MMNPIITLPIDMAAITSAFVGGLAATTFAEPPPPPWFAALLGKLRKMPLERLPAVVAAIESGEYAVEDESNLSRGVGEWIRRLEKKREHLIKTTINGCGGNMSRAAKALGWDRKKLTRAAKRLT